MISMTQSKTTIGPPGRLVKMSCTYSSPSSPRNTRLNRAAPMRMTNTMEVILEVLSITSFKMVPSWVRFRAVARPIRKTPHNPNATQMPI